MLLWIILALPLASFGIISLLLRCRPRAASALSVLASFLNAGLATLALSFVDGSKIPTFLWLSAPEFNVSLGITWDPLAQLMTLIVTWVGALIHFYSLGYMKDDPSKSRFFGYLSLFMFSMLGIVFANQFLMMFIFWELVGLSSYLLIGFWYHKASAADAGKKAFLTNKLGDFGFLLGIILIWIHSQQLEFSGLTLSGSAPVTLIALLLFCGAVGKSAQFPLHVWLPDAMEGPTPVSALIHAATMVAAGVYMLCRIYFILALSPQALEIIAWTGGASALLAALWAVGQNDIKRILAFSTLSQLGYMVMAVGLGAPDSAMFHLSTHACFKALLFLAAGSIIVALHHEQDIWRMGGLWKRMPWTSATFLIGFLSLCGVPFVFSGALSKDAILMAALGANPILFWMGTGTAILTSFYMARLFSITFLGTSKSQAADHAHENGWVMLLPLILLALLSLRWVWDAPLIHQVLKSLQPGIKGHASPTFHNLLMAIPFIGLALGTWVYRNAQGSDPLESKLPFIHRLLASKFYVDEIYEYFIRNTQDRAAGFLRFLDVWIVDGVLIFGSLSVKIAGNFIRCFQTGNLQTYILFTGAALIALLYWALMP